VEVASASQPLQISNKHLMMKQGVWMEVMCIVHCSSENNLNGDELVTCRWTGTESKPSRLPNPRK
jgi:hypothetical protein